MFLMLSERMLKRRIMTNTTKREFLENLYDRFHMNSDDPIYVEYVENLYITESERNFHKGITDSALALSVLRKLEYVSDEEFIELRTRLADINHDFKKIMNKVGDTIVSS